MGKDGLLNWMLSWVWDSLGLGVGFGVCVVVIYIALAMESANEGPKIFGGRTRKLQCHLYAYTGLA